jgi:hypothetical protein
MFDLGLGRTPDMHTVARVTVVPRYPALVFEANPHDTPMLGSKLVELLDDHAAVPSGEPMRPRRSRPPREALSISSARSE